MKYYGITHKVPMWLLPLWKRFLCKHNWHLFDEISRACEERPNELYCDACGLSVGIKYIIKED